MKSDPKKSISAAHTDENQLMPKVDASQIPDIISEKSKALKVLSESVKRAKSEADAAYQAVKDMQEFKDGKFLGWKVKKGDTKEILQSTQGVIKKISDAQKESAEAIRLSFQFNTELAKASEFLFNLGSFNMATNEAMIQDLYNAINSKGGTKPRLPEIIKLKYLEVARRLKEQQNILIKQSYLESKIAELKANTVSSENLVQAKNELDARISKKTEEAREAAIKTASDSLGLAKVELENQISEKANEARESAIMTASESLVQAKNEMDARISKKTEEAREAAIKTASDSLGLAKVELKNQISEKANEARESAIMTASESLVQAKNEMDARISKKTEEAREAAIMTASESLVQAKNEMDARISKKTEEAREAAIKASADNVLIIREEIEDAFAKRIDNATTTSEMNSANLLNKYVKTIKRRIITSYVIGGLGLVGAITTLVFNLL